MHYCIAMLLLLPLIMTKSAATSGRQPDFKLSKTVHIACVQQKKKIKMRSCIFSNKTIECEYAVCIVKLAWSATVTLFMLRSGPPQKMYPSHIKVSSFNAKSHTTILYFEGRSLKRILNTYLYYLDFEQSLNNFHRL